MSSHKGRRKRAGKKGKKQSNQNKTQKRKTQNMIIIVTIIIIVIIIPIHKSTTTIHTHYFKPKFTCPRFIVVVVFNSVGRFRASLLLCTTCVPDVIALLAVWWHNKPKTRPRPTGGASDIAGNSGVDDRGAESLTSDISHFRGNGKKTN